MSFIRTVGNLNFSDQVKTFIKRYKNVGYDLDIMRQTVYLVFNTIAVPL